VKAPLKVRSDTHSTNAAAAILGKCLLSDRVSPRYLANTGLIQFDNASRLTGLGDCSNRFFQLVIMMGAKQVHIDSGHR
jgi:hypothetical protein